MKARIATLGVFLALVGLALVGHFHVLSTQMGPKVLMKVSWSLDETLVNLDAITGMPLISAKTRWPLTVTALQRDGYLESDAEIEARAKREAEAQAAEARRQAAEEMRQAVEAQQRELDRTMRALGYPQ